MSKQDTTTLKNTIRAILDEGTEIYKQPQTTHYTVYPTNNPVGLFIDGENETVTLRDAQGNNWPSMGILNKGEFIKLVMDTQDEMIGDLYDWPSVDEYGVDPEEQNIDDVIRELEDALDPAHEYAKRVYYYGEAIDIWRNMPSEQEDEAQTYLEECEMNTVDTCVADYIVLLVNVHYELETRAEIEAHIDEIEDIAHEYAVIWDTARDLVSAIEGNP